MPLSCYSEAVTDQPDYRYTPAWWARGPHLQTLWGKLFRRRMPFPTTPERIDTPDGDFLDLLHLAGRATEPHLLMLHGLEGSPRSHYVNGLFSAAAERGWGATLMIFRGCGEEPNRQPRFYHSGETTDLALVIRLLRERHPATRLFISGVSLGGNVLLKHLGEIGEAARRDVTAAAAVSVPFDLERGCRYLQHGFARVYDRHFLRTLRAKAEEKLRRFPGLFDADALRDARTIYDFDDAVTAPVHGFADAHDYYSRSSSLGFLHGVRVPTLLLSAIDDPFLPPAVLDEVRAVARGNPALEVDFRERGGHVGFVSGRWPWAAEYFAERRVMAFFDSVQRSAERAA